MQLEQEMLMLGQNKKFSWGNCLSIKRQFPANVSVQQVRKDPIDRVIPQPNYYVEEVLRDKKQMRQMQIEAIERDKHARDIKTFKKVDEKAKERIQQEKLKAKKM